MPRLQALGHELAVAMQLRRPGDVPRGRPVTYYPSRRHWGNKTLGTYAEHFHADHVHRVVRRVGAASRRVARRPPGRGLGAGRPLPATAGGARDVGAREGAADRDVAVRRTDDERRRPRPVVCPARRRPHPVQPAPGRPRPRSAPSSASPRTRSWSGWSPRTRQPRADRKAFPQGVCMAFSQVRDGPPRRVALRRTPTTGPGEGRRHRPRRTDPRRRLPHRPGQVPARGDLPPRLARRERREPLPGVRRPPATRAWAKGSASRSSRRRPAASR